MSEREFDEISRAIGRIEGKLDNMSATQDEHREKLEKIEHTLTAHRIKVAGMASLVSAGIAAAYHFFIKGR